MNARLLAVFTLCAAASAAAGQVVLRGSQGPGGIDGDGVSVLPALSDDGRHVAFESAAENLVPGDTNSKTDVFVLDRATGVIERVSVDANGQESDNLSNSPSISGDGRFVAFDSIATNLVPGDAGFRDVFVKDRLTGAIVRVSVDSNGVPANDDSFGGKISGDGSCVVFVSAASNLDSGDVNGAQDVILHHLDTGVTEIVSRHDFGHVAFNGGGAPAVNRDGTRVAFDAFGALVPEDRNTARDVYLRDLAQARTFLISQTPAGFSGCCVSSAPAISADGGLVVFESVSFDLVPPDTNGRQDVFLRDLVAGTTELLSLGPGAQQGNGLSQQAAISGDGRWVAYQSEATNLTGEPDTNGFADVLLHDRGTGTTTRISESTAGVEGNDWSRVPVLSCDGRVVVFESRASLEGADGNGFQDVYSYAPELVMQALPESILPGESAELIAWHGDPGDPALLFLQSVDAVPFLFKLLSGTFDGAGTFSRPTTHFDPILSGHSLTFVTFGFGPVSNRFLATNTVTVSYQ
jgi:Tol biopolymer transport system component